MFASCRILVLVEGKCCGILCRANDVTWTDCWVGSTQVRQKLHVGRPKPPKKIVSNWIYLNHAQSNKKFCAQGLSWLRLELDSSLGPYGIVYFCFFVSASKTYLFETCIFEIEERLFFLYIYINRFFEIYFKNNLVKTYFVLQKNRNTGPIK